MCADKLITIQDSFDKYIFHLSTTKPDGTFRTYRNSIQLFLAFIENEGIHPSENIKAISNSNFNAYLREFQKSHYSKSTVTVYIAGLNNFRNWLIDNDYLETNKIDESLFKQRATDTIRGFKTSKKGRLINNKLTEMVPTIIPPSTRESKNVNEVEYKRNIAIFQLLKHLDILPYEICSIKVNDCFFADYYFRIELKNTRARAFTVNEEIIDSITNYWNIRGWQDPGDPAFARHDKGAGNNHLPLTTKSLRVIIKETGEKAGIEEGFTPTSLRLYSYQIALDYLIDLGKGYLMLSANNFKTLSLYSFTKQNGV